MTDEVWRRVIGYPKYEVSDLGRVRSSWYKNPRILRFDINPSGYRRVTLYDDSGRPRKISVHSLVAAAFIGPRPDGLVIRHLDGDTANNAADNIRYGTQSENELDKIRHGTNRNVVKTHCTRGHPYDEENTLWTHGRTRRQCMACRRLYKRRGYRRKRAHELVWTFDGDSVSVRAHCLAEADADCRLTCIGECESWTRIVRHRDGRIAHDECPAAMRPLAGAECNVCLFLNESDSIEESNADRGSFELARTAIVPIWTGDYYEWTRLEGGAA